MSNPKSFRLSDKACKELELIAKRDHRTQSAVIEVLIRDEAKTLKTARPKGKP